MIVPKLSVRRRIDSPTSTPTPSEAASASSTTRTSSEASSLPSTSTPTDASTAFQAFPVIFHSGNAVRPTRNTIQGPAPVPSVRNPTLRTDDIDHVQEAKRLVQELPPVLNRTKIFCSIMGTVFFKRCPWSLPQAPWYTLEIVYVLTLCGMFVASSRITEVANGEVSSPSTSFLSLEFVKRTFYWLASANGVFLGGICGHIAHQPGSDVVEQTAVAFAVIVVFWSEWGSGHDRGARGSSTAPGSNNQGNVDIGYGDENQQLMAASQHDAGTFQDEAGSTSV